MKYLFQLGRVKTERFDGFKGVQIFGVTLFQDPSYECLGALRGWKRVKNWEGVEFVPKGRP